MLVWIEGSGMIGAIVVVGRYLIIHWSTKKCCFVVHSTTGGSSISRVTLTNVDVVIEVGCENIFYFVVTGTFITIVPVKEKIEYNGGYE